MKFLELPPDMAVPAVKGVLLGVAAAVVALWFGSHPDLAALASIGLATGAGVVSESTAWAAYERAVADDDQLPDVPGVTDAILTAAGGALVSLPLIFARWA